MYAGWRVGGCQRGRFAFQPRDPAGEEQHQGVQPGDFFRERQRLPGRVHDAEEKKNPAEASAHGVIGRMQTTNVSLLETNEMNVPPMPETCVVRVARSV